MYPSNLDLQNALEIAISNAVSELFSCKKENFYYCCLITTGEAHCPLISAWSIEALNHMAKTAEEEDGLKWSYADSPYCFFGEEYFSEAIKLFDLRPFVWSSENEYQDRIDAMEIALKNVDSTGIFGVGSDRSKIYINVEVIPPDHTNTERAIRLNPPEAIKVWLEEAAEE